MLAVFFWSLFFVQVSTAFLVFLLLLYSLFFSQRYHMIHLTHRTLPATLVVLVLGAHAVKQAVLELAQVQVHFLAVECLLLRAGVACAR